MYALHPHSHVNILPNHAVASPIFCVLGARACVSGPESYPGDDSMANGYACQVLRAYIHEKGAGLDTYLLAFA